MLPDRAVAQARLRIAELPSVDRVRGVTAAQMADIDRAATEDFAMTVEALMESAAHQVAAAARRFLGDVTEARVVALAGKGNNGGDALGAARRLHGWGARVACVLAAERADLSPHTRRQLDILQRIGIPIVAELPPTADLFLDGLLGYSARGPARGPTERLIMSANSSRIPILAIDLPSGFHPDTGERPGETIRASWTVTLALPKAGLMTSTSGGSVGELLLADIGIPYEAAALRGIDAANLFSLGDLVWIQGAH